MRPVKSSKPHRSLPSRCWLAVPLTIALAGCASPDISGLTYAEHQPPFDLAAFFDGSVRAWGIVQDRSGNVIQRFTVDIDGDYQDGILTLDESFDYALGSGVENRIWSITRDDEGQWTGQASDILGEASGQEFGNAFNWRYRMELPVGDSRYQVSFDDWIWAFDQDTLINRSYITKFGITFAEVTIFMQRQVP